MIKNRILSLFAVCCMILSSCAADTASDTSLPSKEGTETAVTTQASEPLSDDNEPDEASEEQLTGVRVKENIASNISDMKDTILKDSTFSFDEQTVGEDIVSFYDFVNKTGNYPVYKAGEYEYYTLGDDALKPMLEELEKAEDFIFIEYFVIKQGSLWDKVYDVLKRKAAAGVDVRVIYDGLADRTYLPDDFAQVLEKDGIKCHIFSSVLGSGAGDYNIRDHRKIMDIDNKVVFSGGMNLADEYINLRSPYGKWKDNCFKITGSAVSSYTLMFLQIWNAYEEDNEYESFISQTYDSDTDNGYIMPFSDNPFDEYLVSKTIYMTILENAKDYVYITTPYLLPDKDFEKLLCDTAARGVDVRLIVPAHYDGNTVALLSRSHYRALVNGGVKLYEYSPGFIHCKMIISDDIKAVAGTINIGNL